jgi:hypothetical protein
MGPPTTHPHPLLHGHRADYSSGGERPTGTANGMNLVAKEFLAARDDEDGVLVLSVLAGAAQELSDALIINPHDADGFTTAILRALDMPPVERGARMRAMRRVAAGRDVFGWARLYARRFRKPLDEALALHRACLPGRASLERPGAGSGWTGGPDRAGRRGGPNPAAVRSRRAVEPARQEILHSTVDIASPVVRPFVR